jgi:hypothetical protein
MEPRKVQPGDSLVHPLQPEEPKKGTRYLGWTCKNEACGKRIELTEALSDTVAPAEEHQRKWMKCAYCGTVELYRMDRITIEEYRGNGAPPASNRLHRLWKKLRTKSAATRSPKE